MNEEQFPPLQEFILNKWATFSDFSTYINDEINISQPLFLEGEGTIYLQKSMNNFLFKDVFYLFSLNNRLFVSAVKENRDTRKKYFDGLYEIIPEFLKSQTFLESRQQNYSSKYKPLGTQIEIECKSYDYHDEHKLLFSKAGKVDLLYSHQLIFNNNENTSSLKVQVYPSLEQTVQWQKMRDKVNERTQQFLESKKNNS